PRCSRNLPSRASTQELPRTWTQMLNMVGGSCRLPRRETPMQLARASFSDDSTCDCWPRSAQTRLSTAHSLLLPIQGLIVACLTGRVLWVCQHLAEIVPNQLPTKFRTQFTIDYQ